MGRIQGQKLWEHNFEITGDLKGPLCGQTFWLGFEAPETRHLAAGLAATPFFPPIRAYQSKSETEQHKIDFLPEIDR